MKKIKPLAFYLPQYHPIPENDDWWGKGFTEWTNVGKAKPLFLGHEQPICPADLGYYDLRVPEVREQQAIMAKEYGIYGFIYYHYWFGDGVQLLERIANEVLTSKKPDFPFCFCWANETWSGRWHGLEDKILAKQVYNLESDLLNHFNYLLPFFKDDRYIKVDGMPVFIIYDAVHLDEEAPAYLQELRTMARNNGFPDLYIVASNKTSDDVDFKDKGYNAKISNAFQKAWLPYMSWRNYISAKDYYKNKIKNILRLSNDSETNEVRRSDIRAVVKDLVFVNSNVETFPMVLTGWDNTPRSGKRGVVLENNSPLIFQKQLKLAIDFLHQNNNKENFLIVKSWNEWAEGNILEPDIKNGDSYLNEIKKIMNK